MTSRERLLTVLKGELPDCVPVCPDISNMIPARLTKKPFWDIYLYQNPPQWKAYIDAVKYFGFDAMLDGHVAVEFEEFGDFDTEWIEVIIKREEKRIYTQKYRLVESEKVWQDGINVYYDDNPPNIKVKPEKLGFANIPQSYEPVVGMKKWPRGEALLKLVKEEMGEHGIVGVFCGVSALIHDEEGVYDFHDNPEKYYKMRDELLVEYRERFKKLMSLEIKPDFICTGYSGTLVFQSVETFRELCLPIVKQTTELCKQYNIPSHIHSCGPESALVKIAAEETCLTVIDPLEIAPAGDSNLSELKRLYGDRLVLKGNLHTTDTMLRGTVDDVILASKKAIDDAGEGGRFILSTGDQCGRDTPDENIFAMIETARTYKRYDISPPTK